METESKRWKLGDDVSADDNILDGFTFRDLILAVHCNCENITPEAVRREAAEILEERMQDYRFLLRNNIEKSWLRPRRDVRSMSNCMTADSMWEQTTLFAPPPITGTPAISLFDNTTHSSEKPSEWMKQLVPDGEYVVMVGTHPLVMRKTKLTADEVPEGHQFYHYLIDGAVYAGIFVGKENAE